MKRSWMALALVAPSLGAWVVGCSDDDTATPVTQDAGVQDSAVQDTSTPDVQIDAGPLCADRRSVGPSLITTTSTSGETSVSVFDMVAKSVTGTYKTAGYGVATVSAYGPFYLDQTADTVTRFHPNEANVPVGSWNVLDSDPVDGGFPMANPAGITVFAGCSKAYVLRYNRNRIAVIDATKLGDKTAPEKFIDLSSYLQAEDHDGAVDMAGAVYVQSQNRVYVALGNIDQKTVTAPNFELGCANTKSTIIAIDATTDELVSLDGTGPGGSLELEGYNPPNNANALWYDESKGRLLVLEAGCNVDHETVAKRGVEAIDLTSGQVSTLLSLDDQATPGGFAFTTPNKAVLRLGYGGDAFFWNTDETTLGAKIPGGGAFSWHPESSAFVGARIVATDAAPTKLEFVSVPFSDAETIEESSVTKLGEAEVGEGAFIAGAELWGH